MTPRKRAKTVKVWAFVDRKGYIYFGDMSSTKKGLINLGWMKYASDCRIARVIIKEV